MIAQLQHLAETTRRRNVRLGIIPWTRPVRAGADSAVSYKTYWSDVIVYVCRRCCKLETCPRRRGARSRHALPRAVSRSMPTCWNSSTAT
ncbi:MAG: Scr1 family TA system antitoxin-like transcriptional regulator [Pseudonocardiales bacterium]